MADFATSSLRGKRVVITRSALQSRELIEKLAERGAIATGFPLVSFAPPDDFAPVDAALSRLDLFDWLLLTSANAVHVLESRIAALRQRGGQIGKPAHVAAVGPTTAKAAEEAGFVVDYVARTHLGVALAEELAVELRSLAVFLPRSDRANPDLPAALRRLGADVTEVVAYRTLPPTDIDQQHLALILRGEANAILFFSPSAVQNFSELVGRDALLALHPRTAVAAVGPVTATSLRELGIHQLVLASDTTSSAVILALESHFAALGKPSAAGVNSR